MIKASDIHIDIREDPRTFTTQAIGSLRLSSRVVLSAEFMRERDRTELMRDAIRRAGGEIWHHLYGDLRTRVSDVCSYVRYIEDPSCRDDALRVAETLRHMLERPT